MTAPTTLVREISAFAVVPDPGAAAAARFYAAAFGAVEEHVLPAPDGRLCSLVLRLGGLRLHLADDFPELGMRPPEPGSPPALLLELHVVDADETFRRAVAAGATAVTEPSEMFWGERVGRLADPFGLLWSVAQPVEDVPPEECRARLAALLPGTTT